MAVIEIQNLTKNYGKARGVEDICLNIEPGEVFGFIGPNGAGKSTTIKCMMNFINKQAGEIFIEGKSMKDHFEKRKEQIGYLPSEVHLYEDLTVSKMLSYSAHFYKKDCSKIVEELVKELEIDTTKKIDELSLGNLKKVGIVLALMHDPKILILDEATSGLDPLMQEKFYEILEKEKQKGTTIFFSSHNLSEIKRICDRVGIIKEGKLIEVAKVEEITHTNFMNISVESNQIEQIEKELRKLDTKMEITKKENQIQFIFQENINEFIKIASRYEILRLQIEEPSIEEVFMHYYR